MLESLSKKELLELIKQYNAYIQDANDEDLYEDGWYPVSIEEFYQNEFQELRH